MSSIQWRPEVNPLTIPQSYRARVLPRKSADLNDLAADISLRHPNCNVEMIKAILKAEDEAIMRRLLQGEQVTKSNSFSYSLSFTGRLDHPDDPLPDLEKHLQVRIFALPAFLAALRRKAQTERLALRRKMPLITYSKDSVLNLRNVLNPEGALQLTGNNLSFDRTQPNAGECVIKGTESGQRVQQRFIRIAPSEMLLLPDIPAQTAPWHNEYTVSVSTRRSDSSDLRSSTYEQRLRSPLLVTGLTQAGHETGILSGGAAASPYVSVIGGEATANAMLRIQVVLHQSIDTLDFRLVDMNDGGGAGTAVLVRANKELTLLGFSGSALTSLQLRVNDYVALKEMIHKHYLGCLVDLLDIRV